MINSPLTDYNQAARHKCLVYSFASIAALTFIIVLLASYKVYPEGVKRYKMEKGTIMITYGTLPIFYIWTMCHLSKSIDGLKGSNFETEKSDVLL